jgi:prophage DNA circulation protein
MPYIERSYALCWTPWTSPRIMGEGYTRMVDNFVDSAIATTNLVNKMFLANMETIRLMMDTTRDYFKLGTDAVKSFKETLTNPKIGN